MSCNYCTAYNREDEHQQKSNMQSALDEQLVHSYDNITNINK